MTTMTPRFFEEIDEAFRGLYEANAPLNTDRFEMPDVRTVCGKASAIFIINASAANGWQGTLEQTSCCLENAEFKENCVEIGKELFFTVALTQENLSKLQKVYKEAVIKRARDVLGNAFKDAANFLEPIHPDNRQRALAIQSLGEDLLRIYGTQPGL